MLYQFEGYKIIAGCDEAGRGCLAGPVYAAAVILPEDVEIECINDSKQLSAKKRYQLREVIESKALTYAVASCSNGEIDEINILNASILAMHRAIDKLRLTPDTLLIDGNRFKPYKDIPHHCIVKGDATYGQIAAASILAKTYRDDFMIEISKEFPQYHWEKNKGYPTAEHAEAILKFGFSKYHRKTFSVPTQINLF